MCRMETQNLNTPNPHKNIFLGDIEIQIYFFFFAIEHHGYDRVPVHINFALELYIRVPHNQSRFLKR